jgi:hypothetical protein
LYRINQRVGPDVDDPVAGGCAKPAATRPRLRESKSVAEVLLDSVISMSQAWPWKSQKGIHLVRKAKKTLTPADFSLPLTNTLV